MTLRVLVACEFSRVVASAFERRGHYAMSCDLLPAAVPGAHHVGDVRELLFGDWDLLIAHPPCTYLCKSGLHWNVGNIERQAKTREALAFVMQLAVAPIPAIAIENPQGRIGTAWRKWDQLVHPYQFGHDASKQTCLWLKGLPKLRATQLVAPRYVGTLPRWANQLDSGQNRVPERKDRAQLRSITYRGIADAMAEQWGAHLS